MSEINRGIPEGVMPTAKVINFEAAKGERLERTQKQALAGVDAVRPAITPISTEVFTEANQPPQSGRRVKFSASTGKAGEIRPLAENTYTVVDLQKARENRLLNEPDTGVRPETHTFTPPEGKPRPIDARDTVFKASAYNDHDLSEQQEVDDNDSEKEPPDKEQIIAMGIIGSKLEQFNLSLQKREVIFSNLADDPKSIVRIAGVLKNLRPQDSIAVLESIADFRKRIDQAIENKAAQVNEETGRELSTFELICLILGSLLSSTADGIIGEELDQLGLKEKQENSA